MAIHPNSGVEFDEKDSDLADPDDGRPKAQSPRTKTVNVKNATGRAMMLHLHETILDDGGGRAFQGRLLQSENGMPDHVELKPGHNAGIHKEFFEAWKKQNPMFAFITAEDEDEPESAKREE